MTAADGRNWAHLDPLTPVIVGVGRVEQSLDTPGAGLSPLGMMVEAARRAGADSGVPDLLQEVGRVSVPEGTWKLRDAAGGIARSIGADGAHTVVLLPGIPQQTLLNETYRDLLEGRIEVGLVAGGEAAHRAAVARRAEYALVDDEPGDSEPHERRGPTGEIVSPPEIAVGAVDAVVQYALIESALRFASGESLDANRDAIADLWAGFSAVAARNPHAAFARVRSARDIRDASPDNRLMAFPYHKWHCSQMFVDQSAAVLTTTLARAQASGVSPDRLVFPLVALESSFSLSLARRAELHTWPAMTVLGDAASAHLRTPLANLDFFEVYSCFPAAVRVQQRALHLPVDGIPTITGGLPFAGGPWNNFVLQAVCAMVEAVRAAPGSRGLVSIVSGLLTKAGLAVYSTDPGESPPLVADLAEQAEAHTREMALADDDFAGAARIDACTVQPRRSGELRTFVLATTTDDRRRCVAISDERAIGEAAMNREVIGERIHVDHQRFAWSVD